MTAFLSPTLAARRDQRKQAQQQQQVQFDSMTAQQAADSVGLKNAVII